MVRLVAIVALGIVLTGCSTTTQPTKVETITVNVPVVIPVPDNIKSLPLIDRPSLPIETAEFNGDYSKAAADISESFFILKNYTLLIEEQNRLYRSYILSLSESTK